MRTLCTLAAAAAALTLAATGQAATHRLPHIKPFRAMTAAEVHDYLTRQVWHDKTALRFIHTHSAKRRLLSDATTREVRWFRTSLRIASANLAKADRQLAAQRLAHQRAKLVREHLAGWLCIHAREGPWNAETGNGFHGGLQMTLGWAGRVGDAGLLSPQQQIAAAEAEAAEHNWSYSWMSGQWPNTFPPCASYFGD